MAEKLRFVFEYQRDEQTMAQLYARFGNAGIPAKAASPHPNEEPPLHCYERK
jgi:hypothetical protein